MLRRLIALAALAAVVLAPSALAANVKIRVEGKTTDDLRRRAAARRRRQPAPGPRPRQRRRRVPLRGRDGLVRRLREPDRQVPGRRQLRLGLQGQRCLAAGRRGQGRAEGRRRRALVLRDLRRRPAARRRSSCSGCRATATSSSRSTTRASAPVRPAATLVADGKRTQTKAGRACIGAPPRARPGGRARRSSLERGAVSRRAASALVLLVLLAGCGGSAGEEEGTAQLWVTRDRGAELLVDAEVAAGQTLMRALASAADVETRYGGRFIQSVNGLAGSLDGAARLVLVRERLRGRPQRRLVPAARRRRRHGSTTARGSARARRASSSARSPSRSCTAAQGETRPAVVRYEPAAGSRRGALGSAIGADSVEPLGTPVPEGANVLELRAGPTPLTGRAASARLPATRSASSSSGEPDADRGGSRSREPRARRSPARRRRRGRAPRRPAVGGRGARGRPARRLPARARRPPRRLPLRRAHDRARRVPALAVSLVEPGRDGALGGADDPGARPARRDDDGALRGGAERAAADGARARVRGLRAPARPRPARRGGGRRAPLGARRRARDPARAVARARRRRARGGGARPRRPARGRARLRDAALAARRRLARARVEPRRGDGGARLRPARRDAGAAAAVEPARPAGAAGWRPLLVLVAVLWL